MAMAAFIEVPVSVLCAALALRIMRSWPRTGGGTGMAVNETETEVEHGAPAAVALPDLDGLPLVAAA